MLMRQVYFRGRHFILVGENDGALTTERAFRTNRLGFAHLMPNGELWRGSEVIGTREDLQFGFAS